MARWNRGDETGRDGTRRRSKRRREDVEEDRGRERRRGGTRFKRKPPSPRAGDRCHLRWENRHFKGSREMLSPFRDAKNPGRTDSSGRGEVGRGDFEGNRVETIGRGKRFFHQFNFKFWIISRNGVKTEGTCRWISLWLKESVSAVIKKYEMR